MTNEIEIIPLDAIQPDAHNANKGSERGTYMLRRSLEKLGAEGKLGKTHQNVLVFVKGDPRKSTEWCGPVDVAELGADEEGE